MVDRQSLPRWGMWLTVVGAPGFCRCGGVCGEGGEVGAEAFDGGGRDRTPRPVAQRHEARVPAMIHNKMTSHRERQEPFTRVISILDLSGDRENVLQRS